MDPKGISTLDSRRFDFILLRLPRIISRLTISSDLPDITPSCLIALGMHFQKFYQSATLKFYAYE